MSLRTVFKRLISVGAMFLPFALLLALMVIPVTGRTQEETGKRVYEANCAVCHGNNGEGGAGPALVPLRHDDSSVLAIVRNGGAQMPALSSARVGDSELAAVAEYLRRLAAERGVPLPSAGAPKPAGAGTSTTLLA